MRDVLFRLELFFRLLFARPDVRFLAAPRFAVRFLAARRLGAFAFLPREAAAAFFRRARFGFGLGAAAGGAGV